MAGIVLAWGVQQAEAKLGERRSVVDMKAAAAEFVAMTLFVIIGCGTACGHGASDGPTRLVVALAFGMAITVLAYTVGHHSGGQINCAVTWSLVLGGKVPWYQGVANTVAQLAGSLAGAGFLAAVFPCDQDLTTNLGTNIVNMDYGRGNAMLGEILGTFFLCFVVWETAVSPLSACGKNAPIAIGFAVFLAHLILLPIDGCSINPTRSFGPAVVGSLRACSGFAGAGLKDLQVMCLGPMVGAAFAAVAKTSFVAEDEAMLSEASDDKPPQARGGAPEGPKAAGRREEPVEPSAVILDLGPGEPTTYGNPTGSAAAGSARARRPAQPKSCMGCLPMIL